jgi:hypothetical protein
VELYNKPAKVINGLIPRQCGEIIIMWEVNCSGKETKGWLGKTD